MKKKSKILTILTSLIGATSFMGVAVANNNQATTKTNNNINLNDEEVITKTFDATLIGARKGTFDIKYTDVDHCTIWDISHSFAVYGDFNFNGGHFTKDGITYTITEIADHVFSSTLTKRFHNCHLTIPSTIKEIALGAFYKCSKNVGDKEIIGINFEEGVEYIAPFAFEKCNDLESRTIKLPNSLKKVNFMAFVDTKVKILDFTALDHVIQLEGDEVYEPHHEYAIRLNLDKIYVKDENMKQQYSNAYGWRLDKNKIEVKQ